MLVEARRTAPPPGPGVAGWSPELFSSSSTTSRASRSYPGSEASGADSRRTESSFSMPFSELKSLGSRCFTTLFATPDSFCQTRGAASFFSASLTVLKPLAQGGESLKGCWVSIPAWDLLRGHLTLFFHQSSPPAPQGRSSPAAPTTMQSALSQGQPRSVVGQRARRAEPFWP